MVESLEEFFPYGDTLIVDDQSENANVLSYLDQLEDTGMLIFSTTIDKSAGLYKGGLYHAMDLAMDYAVAHRYDYVNYLQDDMQCMWYDHDFQNRIEKLFSWSDTVLSVCSEFFKKIDMRWALRSASLVPDVDGYDRRPLAIPAASIVSVERFKNLDFRFSDHKQERDFNRILYQEGYSSLTPRLPHFAWIPWPKATAYGVTTGTEKPPKKKYYYRPISGDRLRSFKSRGLSELPFIEDFCQTWGYLAIKPYWFWQFSAREYFRRLMNNWKVGIIVVPHPSIG